MPPTLRTFTLAGLLLAVIAGCGGGPTLGIPTPPAGGLPSGGQAPTGAGAAQAGASIDACALLTDDDVRAATGEQVASRKHSTLTQVFPSVCDIEMAGGSVFGGAGSLTVSVLASGGKKLYERSFEPYIGKGDLLDEAVSGLGDKAARSGDDHLMVLAGDTLYDVFYIEFGRTNKYDVVRYLAEIILGRLSCAASGCPGVTAPPPLPTPSSESTDTSLTGGSPAPANERFRVVNVYADATGGVALDVYAWDANQRAALLTTVEYGEVSDFFDPGIGTDDIGDTGPHLSFVPHGKELLPYPFNLSDVDLDPEPGAVATILAAPSDRLGKTRQLGANFLYEKRPNGGNAIADPLPDSGVLRINTDALVYSGDAQYFYLSVGHGCLPIAGYTDVLLRAGGGLSASGDRESADGTASVPSGSWTLTVHPDTGVRDGFRCDNPPVASSAPVQIANNRRAFVVLYRALDEQQVHALVVPFDGEGATP